jgi:polysaccharide deacetylase 2 family uncharacterized protein YibQ
MERGFLGGMLLGGVSALAIAAVVSVIAPLPRPPEVGGTPGIVDKPEPIESASSGDEASVADEALATGSTAQVQPPAPDSLAALQDDTVRSPSVPEAGGADDLASPVVTGDAASKLPEAEAPVLPNPQALAPMTPQDPDQLSISTEPAQPPAPPVTAMGGAFDAPQQPQGSGTAPEVTFGMSDSDSRPLTERGSETAALGAEPDAEPDSEPDAEPDVAEETSLPEDVTSVEPLDNMSDAAPEGTEAPAAAETGPAEEGELPTQATAEQGAGQSAQGAGKAGQDVATADAETFPSQRVLPQTDVTIPQTPQVDEDRPLIGTPASRLTERNTGVIVNRLPTTEADDKAEETLEAALEPEPETAELPPDPKGATGYDPRPISQFAVDFAPQADKPLMAIVLIDNGETLAGGEAGLAALRSFPYPVSFAVDASLPDATARMEAFREEGFEVLALIDLPEGATASDAETIFAASLPRLPEAVGVLEGTGLGLQGSREVSDQVADILLDTGHGLVTQDKGLNTMPKLARKMGVPAAHVFRDFDSKGQKPTVIRRFLDQAAFKAGQEGAVIMLGRLRPDTISALLLWGLQDRASKVTLAPVSAVLLRQ